ncbi:MAG: peptide deformylase [Pseudomonadota bacterium]
MILPEIRLQIAPNPIFRQKAAPVKEIDSKIEHVVNSMYDIMYEHGAVGIGANMVGVLKRVIVVDLQESSQKDPITMINPVITKKSQELQIFEEGSLSYPGIKAMVERPKEIEIEYLDIAGKHNSMRAEGWLSTVIQHEVDYLDGKVFLDYISPMKRKMLLKKMEKYIKNKS